MIYLLCHCKIFNAKYDLPLWQWFLLGQEIVSQILYSFLIQDGTEVAIVKG